jgi:threonine/homoserine/homoserine lactone efflux protein
MIDPVMLLAFVPAALALNLTPGADMMFSLAQGARGGARAGWAASGGIAAAAWSM